MTDIKAEWLSKQIDDIVVGKTGYCFIRAEGLIPRRTNKGAIGNLAAEVGKFKI